MNRLKLWVLVALVAGAGVAHLVVASRWVAARATDQLDRSLRAAVAQFEAGSRLFARQVADVAHLAARDPALRDAISEKAAPAPRGRRVPRPPADPSALVEGAVRSAARALGVDVSRGLIASLANDRGLALQSGKRAGSERDTAAVALLGEAMGGGTRQGHVRIEGAVYYVVSVPVAGEVALAFGLPLDPAWAEAIKAATGADVTLAAGLDKPVGTLPGAEAQALAGALKKPTAAPVDVGRLGPVKLPWSVPVPSLPLLFVQAPAWRAQAISLAGLPGSLVILAAPVRPLLDPLGIYQQLFGAALVLLLVAGLALSLLPSGDASPRLPRELLAAADRISNGDFEARAPRLAGVLGTVSTAINRAAEAASAVPAAPPPGMPTSLGVSSFEPPPRPAPAPEPAREDTTAREFDTGLSGRASAAPAPVQAVSRTGRFDGADLLGTPPPPAPPPSGRTGTAPFGAVVESPPPAAAAPLRPGAAAPPSSAGGEEEHWQQVFREFMKARADCGEPSEGLTFDRFRVKLQKNKEGLVQKYACRTVRFQVYVKEGKAALKATPVR
jgi:hypothetical protein